MLLAPAMNTVMWENPFTARHLNEVRSVYGARIIDVTTKKLACGDVGTGALANVATIIDSVVTVLGG